MVDKEPSATAPTVTRRTFRVIGVVLALGVIAVFVAALGDPSPDRRPTAAPDRVVQDQFPHAKQDVIGLLDGLRPGDRIAGCLVLTIAEPKDGVVWVDLQKGEGLFAIGVVAKGGKGEKLPPVETERYDLGIGHVRGTTPPASDVMRQAAEELAVRIRRRESNVPRPEGM